MDDTNNLYDEFGNYIGPDVASSDDDEQPTQPLQQRGGADAMDTDFDELAARRAASAARSVFGDGEGEEDGGASPSSSAAAAAAAAAASSRAIVLHEDKNYFPEADEVYPEAETLVMDADAQPLSQPIIAPVREFKFELSERETPATHFAPEYVGALWQKPDFVRNVALVGHLHHGKTALMDVLVKQTHAVPWDLGDKVRYTDTRLDEQSRLISLKAMTMTLPLPASNGKTYLMQLIDTPGHLNFIDEVTCALRLVDGAYVVVDCVEGLMASTEQAIKQCCMAGVPMVLVINKIDRLVLELKLPPVDAYYKLRHVLEEVNEAVLRHAHTAKRGTFSPTKGNVLFASALFGVVLSLESVARLYADVYAVPQRTMDAVEAQRQTIEQVQAGRKPSVPANFVEAFSKRLWGDLYFDSTTRTFAKKPRDDDAPRSFVQFVLEPFYKLITLCVSETPKSLEAHLKGMGVRLRRSELQLDSAPLLRLVLTSFFGAPTPLVDAAVACLPSPKQAAPHKVGNLYMGPLVDDDNAEAMIRCDPRGPLIMQVAKLFTNEDGTAFDALARVMSGTVRPDNTVLVLGDNYSPEDEEDMSVRTVSAVFVRNARYRVSVQAAPAGALVMLSGIDASILQSATVVGKSVQRPCIFKPLTFPTLSVLRIAIEPLKPSELPKMMDGLRKVCKSYPLLQSKVEESGEHVLVGTGELYMDCVMHDLRRMYAEIEVKVADPIVTFRETVVETSSLKCYAETPNRKNKLTMIAEPLERGLAEDIDNRVVTSLMDTRVVSDFFCKKYSWDRLAARSVWSFGGSVGPNVLVDDCLPTEVDKVSLSSIRDYIVQAIRNVKFRLVGADVASEPFMRGGSQIIPTARRVAYSAFLLATPRLMEPVYYCEIQTPADAVRAVYNVLSRRRGHVTQDAPKAGTPLYTVRAFLPVIDSFGFETDLRVATHGQAFPMMMFDHWSVVPGDPLDKSIRLRPLEPSPPQYLAREFMVKTRRRKGLSDDVTISKFFDDPMLEELAQHATDLVV